MEKILIMGLGRSGLAAAELLKGKAELYAWDSKPAEKFAQDVIDKLTEEGVVLYLGPDAQERLTQEHPAEEKFFDRVVISPGITFRHPLTALGRELIGELELAYENCSGSFVAITGTNGKTTTTTLVGEMLKADDIPSMVAGNIGLPVSSQAASAERDTVMVTEVSSFQLETIKKFRAHVSAVLNITPDHLDRHGNMEEYARVKGRVCENQTAGDYFVYNYDDPGAAELAKTIERPVPVPFSTRDEGLQFGMQPNAAFVRDGYLYVKKDGREKKLCRTTDLNIPGKHNLENALGAAAIAYFSGASAQAISRTLKSFKGVEHRIEYVRTLKGVRYVNDSKGTNPDSTIKAIEATDTPIILIAGGYEKNSDFTEMLNIGKDKIKYLVLLGVTAPRIKETALKCGYRDDQIVRCDSLEACVAASAQLASKGDTVLLSPACASWDMFKSYEHRGEEFKKVVKSL